MQKQKILIVDDEKDLREALHMALESEGFIVIEATDGNEALTQAFEERPDLILLDINMPNISGHQVLAKLRSDPWGKDAHVLLLTNADDATNISQGVKLKTNDYIIKSQTSLKEITKKVKQYLAGYHD